MEQTNKAQSQTPNQQQSCCSPGSAGCGKTWLIVLVIVVAFVAGATIYAWQQKAISSILQDLQTQITNLQNQVAKKETSVTPNPATDETAGWKTYTNITHKYTIEYPASWFVDDKDVGNVNLTNLQYVDVIGNSGSVTKDGSYFLIRVYDLTVPIYKKSWPAGVQDISGLKDGLVSIMPPFKSGTTFIGQDIYFTNGTLGFIFQFGSGSEEQNNL
jgi:hypothetical protein